MKKKILLLRSCSGAGKSSFSQFIKSLYPKTEICSADDFHFIDGKYDYRQENVDKVHTACRCKFYDALERGDEVIIVDNTNTKPAYFQIYIDLAKDFNYEVISLIIENRHGGKSIHNVPDEIISGQMKNILNSIKLT